MELADSSGGACELRGLSLGPECGGQAGRRRLAILGCADRVMHRLAERGDGDGWGQVSLRPWGGPRDRREEGRAARGLPLESGTPPQWELQHFWVLQRRETWGPGGGLLGPCYSTPFLQCHTHTLPTPW